MKTLLIFVLLFVTTISAFAQMSEKKSMTKTEEQVNALASELATVAIKRDSSALENILADDYAGMDFGMMFNKSQLIAMYKNQPTNAPKIESIEKQESRIRVYGDTAVLTARAISKEQLPNGQTATMPNYFTMVAVKKNGRWQIVSTHLSRVMEPMPQMSNATNR